MNNGIAFFMIMILGKMYISTLMLGTDENVLNCKNKRHAVNSSVAKSLL